MTYNLGVSASVTDRYLSINVEFGNEDSITPQFVKSILITLKTRDGLELRTLETLSDYANSDGCFKLGTILFDEEKPSSLFILADTTLGKFNTSCEVSIQPNTITSEQF